MKRSRAPWRTSIGPRSRRRTLGTLEKRREACVQPPVHSRRSRYAWWPSTEMPYAASAARRRRTTGGKRESPAIPRRALASSPPQPHAAAATRRTLVYEVLEILQRQNPNLLRRRFGLEDHRLFRERVYA